MPASVDAEPVEVARSVRGASYARVPPVTALPSLTGTSRDSPVSMDSSTAGGWGREVRGPAGIGGQSQTQMGGRE